MSKPEDEKNALIQQIKAGQKNLSTADLSGADLSGADLSGVDLSKANLSWKSRDLRVVMWLKLGASKPQPPGEPLELAIFEKLADQVGIHPRTGINIKERVYEWSNLLPGDVVSLTLSELLRSDPNLLSPELRAARERILNQNELPCKGANLKNANLEKANLEEADLKSANLREARLMNANLSKADLRWANLRLADLRQADLCNANLSSTDLDLVKLGEANLTGTDLSFANLRGADLRGANLEDAIVFKACFGWNEGIDEALKDTLIKKDAIFLD